MIMIIAGLMFPVLLLWVLCGRADGRRKEELGKGGGMKEGRCTTAAYRSGGKAAAQQRQTERLSGKNKQNKQIWQKKRLRETMSAN